MAAEEVFVLVSEATRALLYRYVVTGRRHADMHERIESRFFDRRGVAPRLIDASRCL